MDRETELASSVMKMLKGKFVVITDPAERMNLIKEILKVIEPQINDEEVGRIASYITDLSPLDTLISSESIEDITVNGTNNIYFYDVNRGFIKSDIRIAKRSDIDMLVDKLKLYATNESANGQIMDVHLPTGSRANIISTPAGPNITIRNFKKHAMSIIDLINSEELTYEMAARFWIYIDGFKTRPANMLIGGMPAAGKTTLLNSMFSFFRPNQRIVTLEETYELDTSMHDNTARLETSIDMRMVDLAKNVLRMRPDIAVFGEIRGEEANELISIMNVGKMVMGTMHGSTTREMVNRLEMSPMSIPRGSISVIDVLMCVSVVHEHTAQKRRIIQISETSGVETQVLLSDLYLYDYRTGRGAQILPSITYRDRISRLLGLPPSDILEEEKVRAAILKRLNETGVRNIESISQVVLDYYDAPEGTLKRLGINMRPVIEI